MNSRQSEHPEAETRAMNRRNFLAGHPRFGWGVKTDSLHVRNLNCTAALNVAPKSSIKSKPIKKDDWSMLLASQFLKL
jgi:hypothetical protein